MMNNEIEGLMSMNWQPEISETDDGVVITIPALDDFALHSDNPDEAWADYLDALKSHLSGYLTVNKTVPVPFRIEQAPANGDENAAAVEGSNAFGIDVRTGARYEMAGS
jgi:hypothetical protein